MRRDIGNEVIVAIAAVAMIAFALAFAILLALTSNDAASEANVTESAVAESNAGYEETPAVTVLYTSPEAQEALTEEPTSTAEVNTETATTTPSFTLTPSPTETASATVTASFTIEASPIIELPGDEATETPEAESPTPTVTDIPPSPTPRPSRTPRPTATMTHTPSPSPTEVPPSPTSSPTMTATQPPPTPTLEPCTAPPSWETYTVQSGNTLDSIARAVGSSIAELQEVNCLQSAAEIAAGKTLLVPRLPLSPVATSLPAVVLPSTPLIAQGCSDRARIIGPIPAQNLMGEFQVFASTNISGFDYYTIEIRPGSIEDYGLFLQSTELPPDSVFARIDARYYDKGLHWLRFSVYDKSGKVFSCEVPLFFTG